MIKHVCKRNEQIILVDGVGKMREKVPYTPLAVIIEDEPLLAELFALALEDAGFRTQTFFDGQSAIGRLPFLKPDILVVDLNLPYVSGEKIIRTVRGNKLFKDTIVIVATAVPQRAGHLEALADFVFIKPISYLQLRDLTKRIHQLFPLQPKRKE
jgi:DNA-binding response OmpR family regulator